MTSTRRNISQPADWWEAFRQQAEADEQSLSEWLGDCGLANLPASVQRSLSQRPPANRPKKNDHHCAEE